MSLETAKTIGFVFMCVQLFISLLIVFVGAINDIGSSGIIKGMGYLAVIELAITFSLMFILGISFMVKSLM